MNAVAMKWRSEAKFARHEVTVKEECVTEIRGRNGRLQSEAGEEFSYTYLFAIYDRHGLVGRAQTRRSALKRAHQHCRNLERGR